MRQMTGTMLLLSSAVVMAAPWAHAEEKTIQLTEAEQQEIKTANEKLLGLTLRFLHDSWPLEIMFPGEVQEEFTPFFNAIRCWSNSAKPATSCSRRRTVPRLCTSALPWD